MTVHKRCHVFDSPGLGKSAAALWASDYLMTIGAIKKVLLVVPLSTMDDTWNREALTLIPHRSMSILYGTRSKRLEALDKDADIAVLNHHGIKVIEDELVAKKFDLVIFDESTALKNASTAMWKSARRISEGARLWMMTGTPTPNSPLDAWGQGRLVSPELLPRSSSAWRNKVMQQLTRFKWIPRKTAAADVRCALQPAIRHSKSECLDLPPVTFVFRHTETSKEQLRALEELKTDAVAKMNGVTVTAVHAAALVQKAMQIAQGAVINDDGNVTILDAASRHKVLREVIDQTDRKVIVFVSYTAVLKGVHDKLVKDGLGVVMVDGSVSKKNRDKAFRAFRSDPEVKVLVAHPQTASHGLTLVEADTIVWFGPVYNAEYYEQGNNRADRPGQTHNVTVVNLWGPTFEKEVYAALQGKLNFQDAVLGIAAALRGGA